VSQWCALDSESSGYCLLRQQFDCDATSPPQNSNHSLNIWASSDDPSQPRHDDADAIFCAADSLFKQSINQASAIARIFGQAPGSPAFIFPCSSEDTEGAGDARVRMERGPRHLATSRLVEVRVSRRRSVKAPARHPQVRQIRRRPARCLKACSSAVPGGRPFVTSAQNRVRLSTVWDPGTQPTLLWRENRPTSRQDLGSGSHARAGAAWTAGGQSRTSDAANAGHRSPPRVWRRWSDTPWQRGRDMMWIISYRNIVEIAIQKNRR